MTPAEAIVAATMNGSCAVSRGHRLGSIEVGKQADIAVYDVSDYREIPYFAAVNFCSATFKRGEMVWSRLSVAAVYHRRQCRNFEIAGGHRRCE